MKVKGASDQTHYLPMTSGFRVHRLQYESQTLSMTPEQPKTCSAVSEHLPKIFKTTQKLKASLNIFLSHLY